MTAIKRRYFLCLCLVLASCSFSHVDEQPLVNYERVLIHKIKYSGENPMMISKWYTSKVANWEKIKEFNCHIGQGSVQVGDIVRIPESLVNNFSPMPKQFIASELQIYFKNSKKSLAIEKNSPVVEPAIEADTLEDSLLRGLIDGEVEK